MSHFNNPIPRSGLPQFSESSKMRSPRDSAATGRLWQKAAKVTAQEGYNLHAIQRLQRELSRLRRRIVGAGYTDEVAATSNANANISQAIIVNLYNKDYVGVRQWNGTDYTSNIVLDMAKSYPARMPNSANIDNVTFTYVYVDDNHRTSNDSNSNESQVMLPRFTVNSTVHMMQCNHSNVWNSTANVEVTWIEVSTEREWVKYYEA